jgi:ribosomal protein S12 methylthiotransferase accessory factor
MASDQVALGPDDPTRRCAAEHLLCDARLAAKDAGVTRLADLTKLDTLGLPVWQTVRPLSRALSVHQGRGASTVQAQLGALMEAVESDAAESFVCDGPICAFDDLPASRRAARLSDFGTARSTIDAAAVHRWAEARNVASGGTLFVPFDCVSLDFTRGLPSAFDRASNGVATGSDHSEAVAVALHELVERDAVTELRAAGLIACTHATLQLDTVPFSWFAGWREKLRLERISIRICLAASLTGTPVFTCELNDLSKWGAPYRALHGQGAHSLPEIALFKATSEAFQSRATYIAGARDDLPSAVYTEQTPAAQVSIGLPLASGMAGIAWERIPPGPVGASAMIEALIAAGYPDVAVVDLRHLPRFEVVRAFACGLGSIVRRRRPPIW